MNRRFRVMDSDSDDSDFPPESGLSQQQAPRRLIIDDPSSDGESGYTTAREEEEEENLDIPFDNLALSSLAAPSPAVKDDGSKDLFADSPSTLSVAKKLQAGGVPHVVRVNRDSGISSLDHEHHKNTDDESHTETPPKRKPSLEDNKSKALLDSFPEEDDGTSTVAQEGRTKTPKRKPPVDDNNSEALLDSFSEDQDDDTSTVVQEGRTKTPKRKPPVDDNNSEALLDSFSEDQDDDTSTVVQEGRTKTPKCKPPMDDDNSEALLSPEPDDTTTVLHENEFVSSQASETSIDNNSEALLDSIMEEDDTNMVYPAETPKREPSFGNNSEALLDSSPYDASTVLQAETPKREPSLSNNSEALLDSSPDDTSTVLHVERPERDPSLSDTSTLHPAQTSKRDPSLSNKSEALLTRSLDSSPDDASTVLQVERPKCDRSLSNKSEALVDSAMIMEEDDKTTVHPAETPKRQPSLSNKSEALVDSSMEDDDTSTIYPAETPEREQSFDNNSEALLDSDLEEEDDTGTLYLAETPRREPLVGNNSEALLVSGLEEDDMRTTHAAKTPGYEPFSSNVSEALLASPGDTSTVLREQENVIPTNDNTDAFVDSFSEKDHPNKAAQERRIVSSTREPLTSTSGDSEASFEKSPKQNDAITVWQEHEFKSSPASMASMNDESQALRKSHPEQNNTPNRKAPTSDASGALTDSSLEEDGTWTVVQEGRVGTPRRQDTSTSMDEVEFIMSSQEQPINVDSPLVDTSSELEDSIMVDHKSRIRTSSPKPASWSAVADARVDISEEQEDDTSTVVQEGRVKTPKPSPRIDDESDDFSESSVEQDEAKCLNTGLKGGYDDCAWAYDSETNEVFLSDENFQSPSETSWPKLRVPMDLFERLYCHQKAGVQWMAGLHSIKIGGILGDDMGMGKTFQALTLLGGLMRARTIRNALVVAPLSVLQSWEKEARVVIKRSCLPKITTIVISSDMAKTRRLKLLREALSCSAKAPYLVITTYGLVTSSPTDFVSERGDRWDYVVLDEGHKIKNPSAKVSKACERICSDPQTRRMVLTGTLIQNNLKELWAVVNFATSGKVFGPLPRFKAQYAVPIEEGRNKNASSPAIKTAEMANNDLKLKLRPHYLQRMKKEFMSEELPTKRELVVWAHLSPKQRSMYEMYVKGDRVAGVLSGEIKSPLEAVTWLKKLCGHPLLVEIEGEYDREVCVDSRKKEDLLRESAKLQVLVTLLGRLRTSGHRTLVFSQSTRLLDIIENVLGGFRLSRIDGSTKGKDRQHLVDTFNSETSNIDVMLLSTKAAGLGLTLIGADRAIVYDPSWNPAEDAQAIDRLYRIGQQKSVTIYRFVAAGTVEEKMYEKQVHKDGIRRAVTTSVGNATERFFDKKDHRRLFELAPAGTCEVLDKIQSTHRDSLGDSRMPTFLTAHAGVVGVSSHDAVYLATESNVPDGDDISTPFGGAAASSTKKPLPVIGRSQRVLSKRHIDFSAAGSSKENRLANVAGFTTANAIDVDMADEKGSGLSEAEIETLLATAESLKEKGNDVGAMSILLELAKNENVKGKQKLRMHQGLAELGRQLGWLYNDNASG